MDNGPSHKTTEKESYSFGGCEGVIQLDNVLTMCLVIECQCEDATSHPARQIPANFQAR